MKPKIPTSVLEELDVALADVKVAEDALDTVLSGLRSSVRAEKVTISAGVEGAFVRLRTARATLAKLRESVGK